MHKYIERDNRRKILLISDDIRTHSGVATISREIIVNSAHVYNWICIGGLQNHPDKGVRFDMSTSVNEVANLKDSWVHTICVDGYGDEDLVKFLIKTEKPDALMIITDPRYYGWLFNVERDIRTQIPIVYYNIWDDLPLPMYNKPYYESCDGLIAISKQTYNINKLVLGDKASEKYTSFVPHGINHKAFYPLVIETKEYLEFKNNLFGGKKLDFVALWNSRNIRRKSPADVLLSFKLFCDKLSDKEIEKVGLVLHTDPIDVNGTDLFAVKDMLFGDEKKYNVFFTDGKYGIDMMNFLYNCADVTMLISSNEGWGLSMTESMMAGRMILGNVTGGIQDQMRFEDEKGNWIDFNETFQTNHRGKYKKCGKWAIPIFPSNISLLGSPPTPYIFDDRVDPQEVANELYNTYQLPSEERRECGLAGRAWAISQEAKMKSTDMANGIIDGIEATIQSVKRRSRFDVIKVKKLQNKHYQKHPISL